MMIMIMVIGQRNWLEANTLASLLNIVGGFIPKLWFEAKMFLNVPVLIS